MEETGLVFLSRPYLTSWLILGDKDLPFEPSSHELVVILRASLGLQALAPAAVTPTLPTLGTLKPPAAVPEWGACCWGEQQGEEEQGERGKEPLWEAGGCMTKVGSYFLC